MIALDFDWITNIIQFWMRYDVQHKTRTRRRIVRNASRQLRAKGLNGPGVAALMKASGLTHGGFYKHFGSRDDLVTEAIEESLHELRDKLITAATESGRDGGWKTIIRTYLSFERCDQLSEGCPIAALAPDVARAKPALKHRIAAALGAFREELLPFMPGRNAAEQGANFAVMFSSMIGAVTLARMMPDPAVRQRILDTVRDRLIESFEAQDPR